MRTCNLWILIALLRRLSRDNLRQLQKRQRLAIACVHYLFYYRDMSSRNSKQRLIPKGRGVGSNPAIRFGQQRTDPFDDGWDMVDDQNTLRTETSIERPRTAITRNSSPDLSFDRSVNPYRGCEHGCVYCYARPSHAYLGLSPGLDFETKLVARPTISELLDKELRRSSYTPKTIAIGTNTDPYQPIERDQKIMRRVLEILSAFNHPVGIVTKGALITRDIDILAPMAAKGLVRVGVSITTLDDKTGRVMEPRVPSAKAKLRVIRELSDAGIPVRIMVSPIIPALTDHELETILEAAADAGAVAASSIVLRLPLEVATLFKDWLAEQFPDRAERVLGRVRELHGGKDYDPSFGQRMTGQGKWAELIQQRFKLKTRQLGLDRSLPELRTDLFEVPLQTGDQLSLF